MKFQSVYANFHHTENGYNAISLSTTGEWQAEPPWESDLNSICVYNIESKSICSRCSSKTFCRYTDNTRNRTECLCTNDRKGYNCETDLCLQNGGCQNGGSCQVIYGTNLTECVCSRPFGGKYCEVNLCPNCPHNLWKTIWWSQNRLPWGQFG